MKTINQSHSRGQLSSSSSCYYAGKWEAGRAHVPFEAQRHRVHEGHDYCQGQAGGLGVPKRRRGKAQRRPNVHRVAADTKREAGDHGRHEDAEVVAEVRARYTERPHRRADKHGPGREERRGHGTYSGLCERRRRRLRGERGLVERVTDEAEREDGRTQHVAACVRPVPEQARERPVAVLVLRDSVPERGVEAHSRDGDPQRRLREVDDGYDVLEKLGGGHRGEE